jgi:hypothetical protein
MQQEATEIGMQRFDCDRVFTRLLPQGRFRLVWPPCPTIAEPQGRQHVQAGSLQTAIAQADPDQDVTWCCFRVFHKDVEITIFVEDAGIEQLIFPIVPATAPVCFDEVAVRVCVLWIFIQVLQV